ncbi:hypothetical protein ACFZAD_36730 [Streptomyces iakyrus]|uniref:hypothetical protein n=1 Tax=Streptomyces iakyrus TaxID=68219 RepID=UPI0036E0197F
MPLGYLLGQQVLMEDEKQQDDVPAVRDALMSPRRKWCGAGATSGERRQGSTGWCPGER